MLAVVGIAEVLHFEGLAIVHETAVEEAELFHSEGLVVLHEHAVEEVEELLVASAVGACP